MALIYRYFAEFDSFGADYVTVVQDRHILSTFGQNRAPSASGLTGRAREITAQWNGKVNSVDSRCRR